MRFFIIFLSLLASIFHSAHATESLSVSIVPSRSTASERSIVEGEGSKWPPATFYVIVTNVSETPILVWEAWNSWGYQSISFELTLPDGRTVIVSKKPQLFTRNFPSTFLIAPKESQAFPIQLDSTWENVPRSSSKPNEPIAVRAIFSIKPPEEAIAKKVNVWVGHAVSSRYDFMLVHGDCCLPPCSDNATHAPESSR